MFYGFSNCISWLSGHPSTRSPCFSRSAAGHAVHFSAAQRPACRRGAKPRNPRHFDVIERGRRVKDLRRQDWQGTNSPDRVVRSMGQRTAHGLKSDVFSERDSYSACCRCVFVGFHCGWLDFSFLVFGVDPFFLVFCLCSSWAWTVSHSQPASWGGRVFRSFADALSAPSLTLLFLSFSVAGRSALGLVAAV